MEQYYKNQLKRLGDNTNIKIKITSDEGATNFMNLNAESLKEIKEFLDQKIRGLHY